MLVVYGTFGEMREKWWFAIFEAPLFRHFVFFFQVLHCVLEVSETRCLNRGVLGEVCSYIKRYMI